MLSFQQVQRAVKMRKPRWQKVSLFLYSSWLRRVRGPTLFDKKLKAFIHCINVGCGDGEEIGDRSVKSVETAVLLQLNLY
jgi:hypothetical protein